MTDPVFNKSNRMLIAVLKKQKEAGQDRTTHFSRISQADMDIINSPSSFDLNNAEELQQKVFFDIQLQFGRRGRENVRNLRKDFFKLKRDEAGQEFFEMSYNELTKNHRDIHESAEPRGRIYETGQQNCPVNSIKKYLSKLEPSCDSLYTKAVKRKGFDPLSTTWYTKCPLGHNKIGDFMKTISKRLNLSQVYTNHCIRATCVNILAENGVEARNIMRITGHRCESSLRSYNHDASDSQKKQMSNILAAARPIDDIASRYTDENSKTVCISATADARTTLRVTPEETSSPSTSTSTTTTTKSMSIQEESSSRYINNYFNFNQCEVKIYAHPDKM